MLKMSWCIAGYGLFLVLGDFIDRMGSEAHVSAATVIPCWGAGLILIAAGLATNLGRRSLRTTGLYVGILLPLALAGHFAWSAVQLFNEGRTVASVIMSLLAAASVVAVSLIAIVRPREGIAARGYTVLISPPTPKAPAADVTRRSEAG